MRGEGLTGGLGAGRWVAASWFSVVYGQHRSAATGADDGLEFYAGHGLVSAGTAVTVRERVNAECVASLDRCQRGFAE